MTKWVNQLLYGDCLSLMREMPMGYVDLVYLDPPFNSNRDYAAIYEDETGRPLPEQIEAFNDLWELSPERVEAIKMMPVLMREAGVPDEVAELWRHWMQALRNAQPRLLSYLSYMTERLLPLRSIVKPTGSIYLHCDPTASHYIKAMMDSIFGHQNFRNEIIWKRTFAHGGATRWGDIHDVILFYTRSDKYTWNKVLQAHDPNYIDTKYRFVDERGRYRLVVLTGPGKTKGASGQAWRGYNPSDGGRHWAVPKRAIDALREEGVEIPPDLHDQLELLYQHSFIRFPERGRGGGPGVPEFKLYLEKGQPIQDIITDIPPINSQAKERLGYPTQKPVALLERIIKASTNEGDRVLDPFCGCATTIEAAHELKREWIGIDIAIHAIKRVAKVRLEDRLGLREGVDFVVKGIPGSLEGAKDLWQSDKHQFQKWAIEQVDGFVTTKKTDDGGIDGRIYFSLPGQSELESMVIEVKGGKNVSKEVVRSLRGVLDRDQAKMAGLIIMEDMGSRKTKNFLSEFADLGMLDVNGVKYPRMQLLTVSDILAGQRFLTPTVAKARMMSQPSLPFGR
ncbi:MAG: restriction endonuclease [Xanthobacteraceae bacterium]|nr:restriction endonuclease [Xanthobacteraceae bacterium]